MMLGVNGFFEKKTRKNGKTCSRKEYFYTGEKVEVNMNGIKKTYLPWASEILEPST